GGGGYGAQQTCGAVERITPNAGRTMVPGPPPARSGRTKLRPTTSLARRSRKQSIPRDFSSGAWSRKPQPGPEYIKTGTLRPLVASATRSETLRGIQTMGEFLPGFEAGQWYGVGAPKNTPPQIIDKLNKVPAWAARFFPARPPTLASSSPTKPR